MGAVATQAYANPRYGPDGLALLRQGLSAEEVVKRLTEADDGRDERQLGVVDAAGRGADVHRLRLPRVGRRPDWPRVRRPGQHPRLRRRRSTRLRRHSRQRAGSLAERLLASLAAAQAAGGDSRGQQSAALLVVERDGGYAGLSDVRRRPPRRRPRAPDRGAAAPARPPRPAFRQDAARPVADRRRRAARGDHERLGEARLRASRGLGRRRESRGTRRRRRRDRPGRARRAEEERRERIRGREPDRARVVHGGPGTLRWTPLRKHLGITAFGINAYTATEAGQDVVEEHTEEQLGHEEIYVVVCGRATFVARRRGGGRAGRLGRLPPRPDGEALRAGRGAKDDGAGGRRQAGRARGLGLGVLLRRVRGRRRGPERAVAELEEGLAERPDHPALHYHLACIFARTGRLDEARRASTALSSSIRSFGSGRTRTRTSCR